MLVFASANSWTIIIPIPGCFVAIDVGRVCSGRCRVVACVVPPESVVHEPLFSCHSFRYVRLFIGNRLRLTGLHQIRRFSISRTSTGARSNNVARMLLTETQAAREAQVDKRTVRRLIETGRLKAVDFGSGKRHHYRIDPADLKGIAAGPVETGADRLPPVRRQHRQPTAPVGTVAAYLPSA